MSGAHHSFKGLKNPRNFLFGRPNYQGTPCLYHAHSIPDGIAPCWRDGNTHACLQCIDNIWRGKFGLDVNRLSKKHRRKALRFWSNVDIRGWDECWPYQGVHAHNRLSFVWERPFKNNWRHHPIQVMMWLTWGDTAKLGSTSLCGERRCMNPLHNLPLDVRHSARPEDYDEAWLANELQLLKQQVAGFHQLREDEAKARALKKAPGYTKTWDPTLSKDGKRMADGSDSIVSPFAAAYASVLHSVDQRSHVMFQKSPKEEADD